MLGVFKFFVLLLQGSKFEFEFVHVSSEMRKRQTVVKKIKILKIFKNFRPKSREGRVPLRGGP